MVMEFVEKPKEKIKSYADEAWKEALSLYFQEFMELCWPKSHREIDWSKKPEFLEQEFQAILSEQKIGKRLTDKIVKVWLFNGKEAYIIIHLEVYGRGMTKTELAEIMMIYRYRIFDRHRTPVASLAILIDDSPTFRPDTYYSELWDSVWQFKYPILKILDFQSKKEELMNHANPFSMVILAQLGVIETARDPQKRLDFKISLTRMLYEKGWNKKKILDFYKFIDGLLSLPSDLKLAYNEQMTKIEEEFKVSYMTTAESIGYERGIETGIKIGREEGREEGREKGREEGEGALLLSLLEYKFKSIPNSYLQLIQNADEKKLLFWGKRVLSAETLDEVFADG